MPRSLCSGCRSIDFRKYIYESRFFVITLGPWEQICKGNGCPFCRLVRDAISLHAHKPLPTSIIKLSNKKSWKCCTSYNEYHGIRSKDYSNEFDLQAYADKTRTESRYQFEVYWEVGSGDRWNVWLRPLREGPFFGRAVDRDRADLALCRKWLNLCDDYHSGSLGQCFGKKTSRPFLRECLRLIDVDKKRIVKGSSDRTSYVALSYVWGEDRMKREMPRSRKAAVRTDKYGEEMIELPEILPRTIRDAIEVTRAIDYRYLWVDSLCIVQDDEQDRDLQIDMMDEIYSNADLTIAAGSGLHADWGLPGVSRPRYFAQRSEIVNGVELAVEFPSFRNLNSGTALIWNSRGWTLQEKVLSKRLLLFTDFQVYFRCANSVCAEDVAMEAGALSTSIKRRQNPFAWGASVNTPSLLDRIGDVVTFETLKLTDKNWDLTFLPNYVALVAEFSQRTFTFQKDALRAILGVLQTLDTSDVAFPGGLPRAWLAEALLWQPKNDSRYFFDKNSTGIPTWSWAAWSLSRGCVWSEYARPNAIARGEPPTTIYMEGSGGMIRSWDIVRKNKSTKAVPKSNANPNILSGAARLQLKLCGTLLSFLTSVNTLKIGMPIIISKLSDDRLRTYYLLDNENLRVGKIWTCGNVARMANPRDFIALSYRKTGVAIQKAVDEKYIPKEPVYERTATKQWDDGDGNGSATGFFKAEMKTKDGNGGANGGTAEPMVKKERNKPAYDWKVVNVMLVEWKGDVAFRVAVGQVIDTAWETKVLRKVFLG